jgi:hypothetical protein
LGSIEPVFGFVVEGFGFLTQRFDNAFVRVNRLRAVESGDVFFDLRGAGLNVYHIAYVEFHFIAHKYLLLSHSPMRFKFSAMSKRISSENAFLHSAPKYFNAYFLQSSGAAQAAPEHLS